MMPNFAEQSEAIRAEEAPFATVRDSFERRVFRASVVILATFGTAYVLWELVDLFLLLFACALVSLVLLTITNALRRRTGLPFGLALASTVLGMLALISGAIIFFGATIQGEFAELATRLPAAWVAVQERLGTSPIGASILVKARELAPGGQAIVTAATTALAAIGGALSGLAIVLVGGLYLAAQRPFIRAGCSG
jgi:predicted PurR-regulated permease PerM